MLIQIEFREYHVDMKNALSIIGQVHVPSVILMQINNLNRMGIVEAFVIPHGFEKQPEFGPVCVTTPVSLGKNPGYCITVYQSEINGIATGVVYSNPRPLCVEGIE